MTRQFLSGELYPLVEPDSRTGNAHGREIWDKFDNCFHYYDDDEKSNCSSSSSRYYDCNPETVADHFQNSNKCNSLFDKNKNFGGYNFNHKKQFSGRVVFVRKSTSGKICRTNSQISSSTMYTGKVMNDSTFRNCLPSLCVDDEAYESFSDNEDEETISDYLRTVCEKDVDDIVHEIALDDSTFNSYLRQEKMDKDTLFAMMQAVGRICQSGNYAQIVEEICASGLPHAIRFYLETSYRSKKKRGTSRQIGEFFTNLFAYYSLAMKVVGDEERKQWEELIKITEHAVRLLDGRYDRSLETIIVKRLQNLVNGYDNMDTNTVPVRETFRALSILLSQSDLNQTALNEQYLPKIKATGPYESIEEYLDTWFRLAREDFAAPLRSGIRQYLQSKSDSKPKLKFGSIKIYEHVCFEGITRSHAGRICLLLNFDFTCRMKWFKWEYSKRLALGSLLLLSANAFESFSYAVIVERTLHRLQAGQLLVILDDQTELNDTLFETSFVMAETEVFYEQYRQCMSALKNFNSRNFPFKEYLVDANPVMRMPKYIKLLQSSEGWPLASELGLDSWQCRALKYILSRNLCLIRGAPGTGKTFLTIQIVRILLKMAKLYPNTLKTPIVIIYATSNAVDAFLTQISRFQSVSDIVRIAGRSNSDIARQFDLRGRVKLSSIRTEETEPELIKVIDKLEKCRERIDAINAQIESMTSGRGIVKYSVLSRAFVPSQEQILTDDNDLLDWLFDEKSQSSSAEYDEDEKISQTNLYSEIVPNDDEIGNEWSIVNEDEVIFTERKQTDCELYCCTMASLEESLKKELDEYASVMMKTVKNRDPLLAEKKRLEERIKSTRNKLITMKLYSKRVDDEKSKIDRFQFLSEECARILPTEVRWMCYWNWIHTLKITMLKELTECEYEYRKWTREYEEAKRKEDLIVMRNANIVGATIAGAVAFQDVLKELQPAIVICEDANQILETNLVAVLTNECQQLILLGDEKQLKPATKVFKLRLKYDYDLSLFERLLKNNVESVNINMQYRMRPEIANLLKSLIYPSLENNDRVCEYESIMGMTKNMYFFDHNVPEQEEGTGSKKNIFEAQFAIELTRYLVATGHNPEKITLLSSHEGQVYLLRETKQKYETLQNVSCVFVDDHVGSVNDIAILCLVRSNDKGQIGHLSDENRTCLSLSRATKGLYVIGNMKMLSKYSKLWHEAKNILESQNAIGTKMALHCGIHDKITYVSTVEDFDQVRRGNCSEICGQNLPCGHKCKSACHFLDKNHTQVICKEHCLKKCARHLHRCELRCNKECIPCNILVTVKLPCGHDGEIRCGEDVSTRVCMEEVTVKSPLCEHTIRKKCSESVDEIKCSAKCGTQLQCGHTCSLKCHKKTDPDHLKYICKKDCSRKCPQNHKCTKKCYEKCEECTVTILRKLDCGHEYEVPCSSDQMTDFKCRKRCLKVCPNCGIKCGKKCYQKCPPCQAEVVKVIEECGHEIKTKCSADPPKRNECDEKCNRMMSCGHPCQNRCSEPCQSSECDVVVRIDNIKGLCGHDFVNVPCRLKDDVLDESFNLTESMVLCDAKCGAKLACGHTCQATCKECDVGKFHRRCRQKCKKTLVCGHQCKSFCEKYCPPCDEPCPYRCQHSNCSKKCGAVCSPCLKKCEWRCKHSACTRICGEICNRKPCYERCKKKLKCEHPCMGFCGEPCPPKCSSCDQGELSNMPSDLPCNPDARFVVLVDCNHVFESSQLEEYFNASTVGEIIVKGCPLCRAPITKTLRFMNYVKQMYEHLNNVKLTMRGDTITNLNFQMELIEKFMSFRRLCDNTSFDAHTDVTSTIDYHLDILSGVSSFGPIDFNQLKSIKMSSIVLECVLIRMKELPRMSPQFGVFVCFIIGQLVIHLGNAIQDTGVRMNLQQMLDFKDELSRFYSLIYFINILQFMSTHFELRYNWALVNECNLVESSVMGSGRYTEAIENKVNKSFVKIQTLMKNTSLPKRLTKLSVKFPEIENDTDEGNISQYWFVCSQGHYYRAPKENISCPDCIRLRNKK